MSDNKEEEKTTSSSPEQPTFTPALPPPSTSATATENTIEEEKKEKEQQVVESTNKNKEEQKQQEEENNCLWNFLVAEDWVDPKDPWTGLREDVFAGVTLAATQVPPAVAFALIAHVNPVTGLHTSFIITTFMSFATGRSGSVSAAAGALAVVMPNFVDTYGAEALYMSSIICGVIYIIPGILGVAKYVRLLPATVMIGFVCGLAIVLFRGQIPAFKDPQGDYVTGQVAGLTVLHVILGFAIMMLFPVYVTKLVPGAFVAIVVGTAIEHIFQMKTVQVGDLYQIAGDFPVPQWPDVDWSQSGVVGAMIALGFVMAIIGLIESLLTVHIMNVLTETKGSFEREAIAMGVANILAGLFRSFAGCAVIGPSLLNFVSGGGRRRVASLITGVLMIVIVVAAYKLINWLPMGALSAVLFGICYKTFDWRSFEMIFQMKIPIADSLVIIIVTIVTVFTDLAIAVGCGLVASLLFFAWDVLQGRFEGVESIEREQDAKILLWCDDGNENKEIEAKTNDNGEKSNTNNNKQANEKTEDEASTLLKSSSPARQAPGGEQDSDSHVHHGRKTKPSEIVVLNLKGTLFFFSAAEAFNRVESLHQHHEEDGDDVVLDFGNGRCVVHDFSVVDALNEIGSIYSRHGRRLHLRNLDPASAVVVTRAASFSPSIFNDTRGFYDNKCFVHIPPAAKKKEAESASSSDKRNGNENEKQQQEEMTEKKVDNEPHSSTEGEGESKKEENTNNINTNIANNNNQQKEIEVVEKELTTEELLQLATIQFYVYSRKLKVNIPLSPVSYTDLERTAIASTSSDYGLDEDDAASKFGVLFPRGFDVSRRFEEISFSGRELSEQQQEKLKDSLREINIEVVPGSPGSPLLTTSNNKNNKTSSYASAAAAKF